MHSRSKSRYFVQAMLVLGIIVALFGLSGYGAIGKTTLNWWWANEGDAPGMHVWVDEMVAGYQAEHPDISINPVRQDEDTLISAFRAAAAAGEGADLQFTWGSLFQLEDVWAGSYAPLSDYWSREDFERLNPVWKINVWDGKIWGVGMYTTAKMLVYNKEFFKKVGLDPEAPPVDSQELLNTSKKLREAGITPIGTGLIDYWQCGWWYGLIGSQFTDTPADYLKALVGDESFASEEHYRWFGKLVELFKAQAFNADAMSLKGFQAWDLLPGGKAAMILSQDGAVAYYVDKLGEDAVGVAKLPVMGDGEWSQVLQVEPYSYGIPSFSEHKAEAADFLKYITSIDSANKFYRACGAFPGNLSFDTSLLTIPQHRKIHRLYMTETIGGWSELWMGRIVEEEVYAPTVQSIFAGKEDDPKKLGEMIQSGVERWRRHSPEKIPSLKIYMKDMAKTAEEVLDEIYGK